MMDAQKLEELLCSVFLKKKINLNDMLHVTEPLLKGKDKILFPQAEVLCLDHKAFFSSTFPPLHQTRQDSSCQMPVLTQLSCIFVADPARLLAEARTAEKMYSSIKEIIHNGGA